VDATLRPLPAADEQVVRNRYGPLSVWQVRVERMMPRLQGHLHRDRNLIPSGNQLGGIDASEN